MKSVLVVGGGIAGLSAGVYAQKCGFDVTILEKHAIAGGICTSWKRKGYLFEGGMHWLGGSYRNTQINKLWRHIGALNDDVPVAYDEPFVEYNHNGTPIRLYRDVDKTEQHWMQLSPQDRKEIKRFCNNIRKFQKLSMPVTDIRGVKVTKKTNPPLSTLFALIPAMYTIKKYAKINRKLYANRFKHEGLRSFILSIPGEEQGISLLFLTMGSLAGGDGGFPKGGSLPFVRRIVDTFTALGGKILYNTTVERIVVENDKATGVIANGEHLQADAVIVATDTMTVDRFFPKPLKPSWLDDMRQSTGPTMATFVCLGINADLQKYPERPIIRLTNPIQLDNQTYRYLMLANYAKDADYSPAGKTAITIQLPGDTYDFWKKVKEEGRYMEEKRQLAGKVIAELGLVMPEIQDNVEVFDIATPLTYERYCGNWKGSWMTEISADLNIKNYPSVVDGLQGVYFAGHRLAPPGGLPPALMSGRAAVQYLCRDTGTLFISEA